MSQVDVLNPDSTDPSALAEGRDTSLGRDATTAVVSSSLPAAPVPVPFTPPNEDTSPTVVSESPAFTPELSTVTPRVYPRIPANIVPPVPLNLSAVTGDQAQIEEALRQSGMFALEDEVNLDRQLLSLLNSGTPFGPEQPLYIEPDLQIPENPYPQLLEDSIQYRASQIANELSPFGLNATSGEVVPGIRNAASSNPFSSAIKAADRVVFGNIGDEFIENLPDNPLVKSPLSIARVGLAARDLSRGFANAFRSNQGRRFLGRLDPLGLQRIGDELGGEDTFRTPRDRFTANLGPIASRIVDPTSEIAQRPIDPGDPTFVGELTRTSPLARDIFTGLAASEEGSSFNPRRGSYGDFGNAGILSALLYAANIPEGAFSGALYQLTNFAIDHLTDHELPENRVRLLDAFRGRDLGFMQEADDARYLSFVGDNSLLSRIGLRNSVLQNTVGFITDVVWGGFTDFGLSTGIRRVTKHVIDPAVTRALPDVPNLSRSLDLSNPGQAVLNLNRALDNAVAARRLDPLPRRVPDNVAAIISGGPNANRLTIFSDGVPLPVRVARLGNISNIDVANVSRTIVREAVDNINLTRLASVDEQLTELQTRLTLNAESAVEARTALSAIETQSPDLIDTQLSIIRNTDVVEDTINRQIRNLQAERRVLAQNTNQLNEVVAQEIGEAVSRGTVAIEGNTLTTIVPDQTLDSAIPLIPRTSIESSIPIPLLMQQYRLDPGSVLPTQLRPVRRGDEQITALAKFHGIVPPDNPILDSRDLLSLRQSHPNLLSRYGNPIDPNLSAPVKRIQLVPAVPSRVQPERSFIPDVPIQTTVDRPLPEITTRVVNSLSRRYEKVARQLEGVSDFAVRDKLLGRLEAIDRRINRVIAESDPESVDDFYVSSLPRTRQPLSPTTQDTARLLARSESTFKERASSARQLHQQLIDAQEILEEQGKLFDELPPLERTTLHNEVATRNNYSDRGVPLLASSSFTGETVDTLPPQRLLSPVETGQQAPDSLQRHISNGELWYHGTKSRVSDLSVIDYGKGSSVSNEMGPGLYLTTDPELADVFAKAHPAVDRVPNPSIRQSDIGEVHQVLALPGDRRILDADQVLPKDSPIRSLFHELVKDELSRSLSPDLRSRLLTNVRRVTRTKPYRDWFQSLRVNWNRLQPDSQTELVRFNDLFTKRLADSGIYGATHRHGNNHYTMVVYNTSTDDPLAISDLHRFQVGMGTLEEQRLNRYNADLFAHTEFNTPTTKVNLAASALSVDRQMVDNLKSATKEAYTESLDATDDMLNVDRRLQRQVTEESNKRISDINRTAPDSAANQLRKFRGDNNSPCI